MAHELRLFEGFDEYRLVRLVTSGHVSLREVDRFRARQIVARWVRGNPAAVARLRELVDGSPRFGHPHEGEAELLARVLARLAERGPGALRLYACERRVDGPALGSIHDLPEMPPVHELQPDPEPELDWIYVQLLDVQGNPRPNEAYEVTLPDGSTRSGTLDDQGGARLEGIAPGTCLWRFPELHPDEWRA
jgi:hypothetical protein